MALISASNLSLSFSGPLLLDDISLQIHEGERICLLGRNGEGKSTLMRILAQELAPDSGEVAFSKGLSAASLPQEVPASLSGTVYDVVAAGAGEGGLCLAALRHGSGADPAKLVRAHRMLDEQAGWSLTRKIDTVVTHLGLDPDARFESMSGGVKRKTLLARALVDEPDVLFLDEPTNHLDVEAIRWLEEFLVKQARTLFFVTHDRMFLRHVANRILELDRGQLVDWACDYDTFLQRKADVLATEETLWRKFDQKLKEEEIWIRKGIKARRTRNEGRVRALNALRLERRQRRERSGAVTMQIQEARKSGGLVLEVEDISFSWGGEPVIRDFSANIMRGDKVGIVGPNGAGKTTLLKLLLGELEPETGRVRQGTRLEVAYSDQMRSLLDETSTARDIVAEGSDYVDVNGNRRHVIGYLKEFLFTPERAQTPVGLLSGGERNRLLLAKLFTRPCNVLVLDEPTNDLDQETLELLEELIGDFSGTVLVVSHDREFLNNTVTSCLVFEGGGRVVEYAGGYDDWLVQRPAEPEPEAAPAKAPRIRAPQERKLTWKETRELEALPDSIEALEGGIAALRGRMIDPEFYANDHTVVAAEAARLEAMEFELDAMLARWDELEELRAACES
jgi:ATP-binding cassette subfamily F protein uup